MTDSAEPTKPPHQQLISALLQLHNAREEGAPFARAKLAELRQDARTGRLRHLLPFVLPFGFSEKEEDDALLLAKLFALHSAPSWKTTFPSLMNQTARERGAEDPFERRFQALLATLREDLEEPLRKAMALVSPEGLNWEDLYFAIRGWDDDPSDLTRSVKRRWARAYWARPRKNEEKSDLAPSA